MQRGQGRSGDIVAIGSKVLKQLLKGVVPNDDRFRGASETAVRVLPLLYCVCVVNYVVENESVAIYCGRVSRM